MHTDQIPQRMLTRRQVSETYAIPEGTLRNAAWRGGGPRFLKMGRAVRYLREDVERWINDLPSVEAVGA